jgi:diaminopimelate epimerase
MNFRKYHGTGNDFLLVDARQERPAGLTPEAVRRICDRNFGVGGDGILLVETGDLSPWFMRVLNSDGSEAEMCGNGIRCVAKFIAEHLWMGPAVDEIPIQTPAGIRLCRLTRDPDGRVVSVAVSMGAPAIDRKSVPMAGDGDAINAHVTAGDREFVGTGVSMGNPHFVVFENISGEQAAHWGALLQGSPMFPVSANIEFAARLSEDHFRLTVYERGCGLTMACGTGASATVVAAVRNGLARMGTPVRVDLPGGPLRITVGHELSDVTLEGPAVEVFQGTVDIAAICR